MSKILDYFDGGFYLNLDRRTDRRENFERRSSEQGLVLERFSAVERTQPIPNPNNDPIWHIKVACTESHFEMIREAKRRGWKNCLIMEDDCVFESGFAATVRDLVSELRRFSDWDLFYFGGEPNGECLPLSPHVARCTGGVYGTHAYAISEGFYDRVLRSTVDSLVIDAFYVNFPERNYLISRKLLAWQDDTYSDLMDQYPTFRTDIYRNAYKKFVK